MNFLITIIKPEKLRTFIVFLNVIVSLLGVASLSSGIVLKVCRKEILQKLSGPRLGIIFTSIEVTMAMNVLVCAISMVCAIVCFRRENARRFTMFPSFGNKVLLSIWMLCNLVVILSNVILSIMFVVKFPNDLDSDFGEEFIRAMDEYGNGGDLKRIIDEIQFKYRCCGWYSYKDWLSADWIPNVRNRGNVVPFSCCNISFPRLCSHDKIKKINVDDLLINESIYHGGCSEILMSWWRKLFYSIAFIVSIIAFLQVLTACLIRVLRRTDCGSDDDDDCPSKLKRRLRCLFGCLRRRDDVDIEATSKRRRRRNINVDTSGSLNEFDDDVDTSGSLNEFDEISQSSTENRDEPVDFDGIKSKVKRKRDKRLKPRRFFANGKRRKTLGVRKRLPAKKIRTPTKGVSRIKGIKKGKILKIKKRFFK